MSLNAIQTYQNKWIVSYETLLFNTVDGDLDIGQYALDGNNTGYYVRTKPKAEANFEWVPKVDWKTGVPYDISGLTKVNIKPNSHAYYDEFLTAVGATALAKSPSTPLTDLPKDSIARVLSNAKDYDSLRTKPNAPQPSRTEVVEILPPDIPDIEKAIHSSIGFDATSNSGDKGSVSSYSWSHTCTGSNLLLACGVTIVNASDLTVTTVTYNSVALTPIRSDVKQGANNYYYRSTILYLIAPATGSNTVAVTLSGTAYYSVGGVVSYTGAKQSGQPDANNGANGTGTAVSVDVTTVADNCWVFDTALGGYSFSACGNTQRWNVAGYGAGADTNGPKTPPGAQTMSWTQSSSYAWVISAASFAPIIPHRKSSFFKMF
jgi:hypothetical protein